MNFVALLYLFVASIAGIVAIKFFPIHTGRVKFIAGPALGIIIITEFILIFSLLFQFSHYSIVMALYIFIFLIFVIWRFSPPRLDFPRKPSIQEILQNHWPLWFIYLTVGTAVFFILWTKILAPSPQGLMTGGEGLFGDTSMHSAFTMSIVEQGLPPTNPLFARIPLVYPFLTNLFSASLIKLGMNMRFAFILPQMIFFVGFVGLFYSLIRKISDLGHLSTKQANCTALLAMLIFFLGWGLGFGNYLKDVRSTGSWEVTREYTNNIDGFALHNVVTGIILPARTFLPGLVIGMVITLVILSQFSKNNSGYELRTANYELITLGLLLGILPLWHTHTFIFFGIAIGVWILTHLFSPFMRVRIPTLIIRWQGGLKSLVIIYGIAFVLVFPVLLWSKTQVSHTSFIHSIMGWSESSNGFFTFWWNNTGFLIPLAFLGSVWMKKELRLFFLPAAIVFILANLVSFQPWDWDNIKIFSWVFLFASITSGFALTKIAQYKWLKPMALILFATLTASGTLSLINLSSGSFTIYDNESIDLAEWVKSNTPKDAVFLVDPWANHPIPGLTGRSVYMGYPGHLWVHGIEYTEREQTVSEILKGNTDLLTMTEVPINYLIVETSKKDLFELKEVFSNQKYSILQTKN